MSSFDKLHTQKNISWWTEKQIFHRMNILTNKTTVILNSTEKVMIKKNNLQISAEQNRNFKKITEQGNIFKKNKAHVKPNFFSGIFLLLKSAISRWSKYDKNIKMVKFYL